MTPTLVPSLEEVVRVHGTDPRKLTVSLEADSHKHDRLRDKHKVCLWDGQKMTAWNVASLRELFRGDRKPPADMDHYPEAYREHFFFIETQLLTLCDAMGDRTDQELEEIYAALRRRPDGRSLGVAHDFLWQVAALLLGTHILSEAEYEALIGPLLGSARKWGLRPISRNYVAYLRNSFGDGHSSRVLPQ